MLRILDAHPESSVLWVVLSATSERAEEARRSAEAFLAKAKSKHVEVRSFRESFFPYVGAEIKDYFETLKDWAPDLVFTHYRHDLHQDHRVVNELTWNTFRGRQIFEYEIPKYDGDLGTPNVFVPLEAEMCREKVRLILENFVSQRARAWFDAEVFMGLLRLRGVECASPTRYAEAFYGRKVVLNF
jgi:LmbE family N-acetylglucosaminyl deacetylase